MKVNKDKLKKLQSWLKPKQELKFVLDEKEIDKARPNTIWVHFKL